MAELKKSENINMKVPCIACSKPMLATAAYCPSCGAPQKRQDKQLPTQLRLFVLNFFCPGAGDWRLGARGRAALIFIIVLAGLIGYAMEVMTAIQDTVNDIAFGSGTANAASIASKMSGSVWLYLFIIGYIVSFIDSFFLRRNMEKKLKEEKNALSA